MISCLAFHFLISVAFPPLSMLTSLFFIYCLLCFALLSPSIQGWDFDHDETAPEGLGMQTFETLIAMDDCHFLNLNIEDMPGVGELFVR